MSAPVNAQVRYLNPEWRSRHTLARIGDWESLWAHTSEYGVQIDDARRIECGLDSSCFVLSEHVTGVRDFHDEAEVTGTYFDEMVGVMKRLTDADEAFVTNHFIRWGNAQSYNDGYTGFLHADYSLGNPRAFSEQRLELLHKELDASTHWEFAWYNTWQPIEREVQQYPLTVIDARSVAHGDILDYYYTGHPGELILESIPVFNPEHKLYYYPRMQTTELLVFKQLDTRVERFAPCLHSAFVDATAPADALERRSIEVRVMCAFGS